MAQMDFKRTTSRQNVSAGITAALVSAILEWMLMFMIFVDAGFSYMVTRFAGYCRLRTPCVLCSRLDRVLGDERVSLYRDLICSEHKLKISSLVPCQLHYNLDDDDDDDVRGTCENCFFSFAVPEPHRAIIAEGASSEGGDHGASSSFMERPSESGQMKNKDSHLVPHVEYTKMKVTSETESESSLSDTASPTALTREMETQILTSADFPALEKFIPPVESSVSQFDNPTNSHQTVESEVPFAHGLEELNRQQADCNNDVGEPSQLESFSQVTPSPDSHGTQETYATNASESKKEAHVECGERSNVDSDPSCTVELRNQVNMECGETSTVGDESSPANEIPVDSKPKTCSQIAEPLDLGEAYKFAVSTRGRQLSGKFLEQQKSMADSTRASEDLKLLLSQLSCGRGIELSLRDMSPRMSANTEEFRAMDASSGAPAIGMQIIQRRMSLERNESNLSLDGSTISDIEGESVVDRLRRQVEHDKKIMSSLYKELEEEINASAIAANQAMAMITRLQEEKASLHMEALQYLRMMDEQSEYDGEALQNANDLLAEKEKQIKDFEYELQRYRNDFGDVSFSNTFDKPKPEPEITQKKDGNRGGTSKSNNDKHDIVSKNSLELFEDEKQYILQCLRKLENKLFIFADPDMIDGENKLVMETSASDTLKWMDDSQENGRMEKNHPLKETPPKDLSGNENSQHGNKLWSSQNVRDTELDAFRHELSIMNNRLEALEAEQNVIECSFKSLEKGSEGLEFIREIVARLQELHSDYIGTRDENFACTSQ